MGATGGNAGGAGTTPKMPEGFDFTELSESKQIAKIKQLQVDMGQDGYEAGNPNASPNGKLYVNTGKSMCINSYLNSDGKTYKSDFTDWDDIISESWVKNAITQLDSGMKPLTENVKGYKYMSPEALGKLLGLDISQKNINQFIDKLETDKSYNQKLDQILQNTDYTHKGYTSMSYVPEHGSYDNQPVRLNLVMTKGQPAIITNNHAEHEIVGGRNTKYNFTSGHVENVYSKAAKKYIKQLVIDVFI